VLVQLDQGGSPDEKLSLLLALDVATGKTVYKVPRPVRASWSSPLLINTGARDELILAAEPFAISSDPATGKELWRQECLMGDVAPAPCFAGGLVIVAQDGSGVVAIKPPANGGKAETVWTNNDWAPDTVSPVSDGKLVWVVSSTGMLVCMDLKTGEKKYEHDLGMPCESSPLVVGNALYITDTAGVTHIVEAGPEFKSIGTGRIGEGARATPVLVDGRVYLRGDKNLFALGAK
jgi:outer membrane protein assembly factor BamB